MLKALHTGTLVVWTPTTVLALDAVEQFLNMLNTHLDQNSAVTAHFRRLEAFVQSSYCIYVYYVLVNTLTIHIIRNPYLVLVLTVHYMSSTFIIGPRYICTDGSPSVAGLLSAALYPIHHWSVSDHRAAVDQMLCVW